MRFCWNKIGKGCRISCAFLKAIGIVMAIIGALLVLLFVPAKLWLVFLGMALIVGGLMLCQMGG